MKSLFLGAAIGTATVAFSTVASPAPPTPAPAPAQSSPQKATASTGGQMRAYVDPETGKLVGHPVTEEQKRAAEQARQLPAPVVQTIHHPDGSTEDVLNGAANAQMIATVGEDGKLHVHCTEAAHEHALDETGAAGEKRNER